MAIYIFGATHGTEEYKKILPDTRKDWSTASLGVNDIAVVLGDFGIPFITHGPNWYFKRSDKTAIANLARLPFKVLFIDGNHDNHDFWRVQTKQDKFGGKVQKLIGTENVYHLMRGEYYEIQGKTFWVMGGACSHDLEYRTPNKDWWTREIPSKQEFEHGMSTLKMHEYSVDYVLTHTVPTSVIDLLNHKYKLQFDNRKDQVSKYLDEVMHIIKYKHWFSGHLHIDIDLDSIGFSILYNKNKNV